MQRHQRPLLLPLVTTLAAASCSDAPPNVGQSSEGPVDPTSTSSASAGEDTVGGGSSGDTGGDPTGTDTSGGDTGGSGSDTGGSGSSGPDLGDGGPGEDGGDEVIWDQDDDRVHRLFHTRATFQELERYEIHTDNLVPCEFLDGQVVIRNWVPRELTPVSIVAHHEGRPFQLYRFDRFDGISEFRTPIPWSLEPRSYEALDGSGAVELDPSTPTEGQITCAMRPQTDVQRQIYDHEVEWTVTFRDNIMNGNAEVCRQNASVNWRPIRPQFALYAWTSLLRASQAFADPRFYEMWMATPFFVYEDKEIKDPAWVLSEQEFSTYPNDERVLYDAQVLADGRYFNKAHRQMVYDKYFVKLWRLGQTGGGGLAGGSRLGISHTSVFEQIWNISEDGLRAYEMGAIGFPGDKAKGTSWNLIGHEIGHTLGFGHKDNYCKNGAFSHVAIGTIVHSWVANNDAMWVTAENMVGRDETWEQPYKKNRPAGERSRPLCDEAFEWGGPYGRHDLKLPEKGSPEWDTYIQRHLEGTGLEYLRSL